MLSFFILCKIISVESYTNYRVGERFLKKLFCFYCLAPAARTVGHFTPSLEAKGASSSGVRVPSCSKRATCAFRCPAPAARLFGGFASSYKAKSACTSEAPSPSQSKRAACAFLLQK